MMKLRFYGHEIHRPELRKRLSTGQELSFVVLQERRRIQRALGTKERISYIFHRECGGYSPDLIGRNQQDTHEPLCSGTLRIDTWHPDGPHVVVHMNEEPARGANGDALDIQSSLSALGQLQNALQDALRSSLMHPERRNGHAATPPRKQAPEHSSVVSVGNTEHNRRRRAAHALRPSLR